MLVALLLPGCTSGAIGLPPPWITFYETADGSGRAVCVHAVGVCLLTQTDDAGLVIGSTRRMYFFEGPNSRSPSMQRDGQPLGSGHLKRRDTGFPWRTIQPVAAVTQTTGAAIHLNRRRIGATMGANTRHGVYMDARESAELFVQASTADFENAAMSMRRTDHPPTPQP